MRFRIKNWKLALLAMIFIAFFSSLGMWQISRAHQKEKLLSSFANRTKQSALTSSDLNSKQDVRFYRAELTGTFDNTHTFILDNKIFHGKVGYEIYTPFKIAGRNEYILVDRGFVAMGRTRSELPTISPVNGTITISGILNLPPRYVAFGSLYDKQIHWPLLIEYVNLAEISKTVNYSLFSYTLSLNPEQTGPLAMEWQVVTMTPERHKGYATQWFALAFTLLILFVALNFER